MKKMILITILTFALCGLGVNAQIIYTDVIPDKIITNPYGLDLNNDTQFEFILLVEPVDADWWAAIDDLNTNNMFVSTSCRPYALNANDVIGSAQPWENCGVDWGYLNRTDFPTGCHWIGVTDKYIGLKFQLGFDIFYGWARLDVPANATSITLKDYAYNMIPDQPIKAGEGGPTSITNVSKMPANIIIYPNPFTTSTTLEINSEIKNGELKVYDMLGQVAYHIENISGNKITIDRNNLPVNGIYFYSITQNNKPIASGKLVAE